jgi:ribonuclease D
MGLNNLRDRLCVVQISDGNGDAHLVHFPTSDYSCPNLKKLLQDKNRQKIFHFARFDVSIIEHYLGIQLENIYCTKIVSRLVRTYTDMHGLKDLCSELIDVKLNKQQQTSDWGAKELTKDQISYAAADVLYLHRIREKLNVMLEREGRQQLAQKCFDFLPTRASLDLMGWGETDIFHH